MCLRLLVDFDNIHHIKGQLVKVMIKLNFPAKRHSRLGNINCVDLEDREYHLVTCIAATNDDIAMMKTIDLDPYMITKQKALLADLQVRLMAVDIMQIIDHLDQK